MSNVISFLKKNKIRDYLVDFFKVNNSYKAAKYSLLSSLIVGALAYNLFVVYEYTNPDGIIEGFTSYINAAWHIEGCGRWMIPIILSLSANVHMPFLTVFLYVILTWLSAFMMTKIWHKTNIITICVFACSMCVTQTTIEHILTNTVAVPYAIGCFLSTLFVYSIFEFDSWIRYPISIIILTCSIGIYQTYIGQAACLMLMTIAMKVIQNKKQNLFRKCVDGIACGVTSSILYYLILKIIMIILNLESTGRMSTLSLKSIVTSLFSQIKYLYVSYFSYLNDNILHKNIIYFVLIFFLVIFAMCSFRKVGKRDGLLILFCIALIPFACNIASLIANNSVISISMSYQNILLVPFTISFLEECASYKIFTDITKALAVILCWLYIISANATFKCYKISYETINYQMSLIMNDVIHNENYVLNETKVIFAGYPNDDATRNGIKTYRYAYSFPNLSSVAFWDNIEIGYTYNRQKYILNYFGIDVKDISFSEYMAVVDSDEFKSMELWPNSEGIKMINGIIVVKLTDAPYTK